MSDKAKVSHGLNLISRLGRMKEQAIVCDFTIKVGGKSYPVHKTVLVAMSDYFEGLFCSNMVEVHQGFIELEDVEVNAFEKSLEFMYSGSTVITAESVQDILYIAELFQLNRLKDLCFHFLADNLTVNNCLSIINLATTYNKADVKVHAEKVMHSDFTAVISSEIFPSISKSDLLRYISKENQETKWKAVVTWSADKKLLSQMLEEIAFKQFPFQMLLDAVLHDPIVARSGTARNVIIRHLFSDPEKLEKSLTAKNCISLKLLAKQLKVDQKVQKMIGSSLEESFGEIMSHTLFCNLSKEDIAGLFQSEKARYSSEILKWQAALKWVKHDVEERKQVFWQLFRCIKFENLPTKFLKENVRNEPLVKESRKCLNLLMDVSFGRASAPSSLTQPQNCYAETSSKDQRVKVERVFGREGGGPECLCEPWGICTTREGNIIVADAGNHRIQVFDQNGHCVNIFGHKGHRPGEFLYPADVAVSASDAIVVADSLNHRIQIFDSEGRFIRKFGKEGDLSQPCSVTVGSNDNVYVAERDLNRVKVYSLNGQYLRMFTLEMSSPVGEVYVAVSPPETLVVLGSYGGYFWAYERCRKLLWEQYSESDHCGGLACHNDGRILIGDCDKHMVEILDKHGKKCILKFGSRGSSFGQMKTPRGIALLPNGNIAVSDSGNHRIQIFRYVKLPLL